MKILYFKDKIKIEITLKKEKIIKKYKFNRINIFKLDYYFFNK